MIERASILGHGVVRVLGPDGAVKQTVKFSNLVTQAGDQFYAERAVGIGSWDEPSGMKLGTGTTSPAKTGQGAHLVDYIEGSNQAFDDGFPSSSLVSGARRITFEATWDPGDATADGIAEVIITTQDPLSDNDSDSGLTIARALLSPVVNKGAGDTLTVTWNHDLEAS